MSGMSGGINPRNALVIQRAKANPNFGGELAKQAATAGTQGEANGHLLLAVGGASQKKIGDVDAADEKDKSDGA
jgi:hypothetical protein